MEEFFHPTLFVNLVQLEDYIYITELSFIRRNKL